MSLASQQRHPFNDDFSRGNRLNSAGAMSGELRSSSVVALFFAMKPLTKTDRCAGALLWRRNQLLILHFSWRFLLTSTPMATKDINVHFYTHRSNSCNLYQRIPRNFGSYCPYVWLLWMRVFHIDKRPSALHIFMFRVSCTYLQLHYWIWCYWKRKQHSTTKEGVGTFSYHYTCN